MIFCKIMLKLPTRKDENMHTDVFMYLMHPSFRGKLIIFFQSKIKLIKLGCRCNWLNYTKRKKKGTKLLRFGNNNNTIMMKSNERNE